MSQVPAVLGPQEEDILKMLACKVHLGSKNVDINMSRYVFKRRPDGINIINLQKTWEKLVLAARIIVAIENPAEVCVISARPWGQRAVLKFSNYTGAHAVSGRFTPGTFTNQIQENFLEPRLLIVTDPFFDLQPLKESAYVNIPTIAFCQTDNPVRCVDVVIPANNKDKQAIGLLFWFLAREVLRLRGTIPRDQPWNVMVDMFFYRDPDDKGEEQIEGTTDSYRTQAYEPLLQQTTEAGDYTHDVTDWGTPSESWSAPTPSTDSWGDTPEPAAAPADSWDSSIVPPQSWNDSQTAE
jgi:small subunit ribosomal protein SAe